MANRHLPTGTVTFLFTDIQGSTRLLQQLGNDFTAQVVDPHCRVVRSAIGEFEGTEVSTEGDSFFVVFGNAAEAVKAAARIQQDLAVHSFPQPVLVRMGLHTGEARRGGDNYIGIDVNRAARIAGAGHGGQVLLSESTRSLAERSLPPGVSVRDLGKHRLKDLAHPEHLYQLVIEGLPAEFPPPKTLDARPNNLPIQLTSFVGREQELARVKEYLLDGTRLLTLTGPGGTGKTRLALQAAAETLTGFQDGAFFVDLAPVTDPEVVISKIASALGVMEQADRSLQDTLEEHLRDKDILLVLDNFEQVVPAGAAVERLLRGAPGVKVLATSREVLHRYGEQEFPVPPLGLPDPDRLQDVSTLTQFEAIGLFIERAAAVKPGFTLTDENAPAVAQITARLEGLPLAIELAASRVKLLSPQAILDRLDKRLPLLTSRVGDAPERRRTLRGAIEWSYDLLDEDERRLFEHVSVFSGGGTLEAMESVCSLAAGTDTLEGLGSLVDKSLLRQAETQEGEPRFIMLETIREYAQERLAERGEREQLSRGHAEYFVALTEEAEPHLTGPDAGTWLDRLTLEHDNIRAALGWSLEADQVDIGMRLASAVWRFWHQRAHFREARSWFDRLLGARSASGRTSSRLKGLTGLGGIAYWQGDYPAGEAAYEEAVSIARELGDPGILAKAVVNLSYMPALRGDIAGARRFTEEAVGLFRQAGEKEEAERLEAEAGYYLLMERNFERARPLLEQAFGNAQRSGDLFQTMMGHHMMGQLERLSGNLIEAARHYRESIVACRALGNEASMLEPIEALGSVASLAGDHLRGVRLVAGARAAREALGGGPPPEWLMPADVIGEARKTIGDEAVDRAIQEGSAMTVSEAADYALSDD
jgi:predicted ATPase/class 3 adenylate cyclase